ncbi:MAG: hypothetical protein NT049_10945 [Planctomycetota bacterium]|nr:hypothetical protein [Planctomycetota bacterium]
MRALAAALLILASALLAEAGAAGPALHWRPLNEPGCGGWITSVAVSPHEAPRVLVGGDMLGAGLSEDGGESWQPAFGFASWEIADFTWHPTDPKTVWVGTMSGPYVSTDGGRNWQARREGFPPIAVYQYSTPIQKVLFDPKDAAHLLAFGGSHRRWQAPATALWGAVWESRDGGACVSTDGGRTWEVRNSGLPMDVNVNHLAAHPTQKDTVWLALGAYRHPEEHEYTPGTIYKSTDGGRTWRASGSGLGQKVARDTNLTSRYEAIAVAPTSPDTLLTCDTAWNGATLYRSTDGGASWQPLLKGGGFEAAYPAGLGATVIEFSPRDAAAAFIAGSEYMLRTLDGGKTWTDVTARRAGAGWVGRGYSGLCCENIKWDPRDPKHAVLLGMDHGNFWQSRDGLASWAWGGEGMPGWGGSSDITFAGDATMYVTLGQQGSFTGIGRSTDGGRRWTILASTASGLPNAGARAQPLGIYALAGDPKTV